jgi:hypothetical protein
MKTDDDTDAGDAEGDDTEKEGFSRPSSLKIPQDHDASHRKEKRS